MELAMVYEMILIITFVSFILLLQLSIISADDDHHIHTPVYIVLTSKPRTTTSQIQHNLDILNSLNTLNDEDDDDVVAHSMIKHHYLEVFPGFSARMSSQQSESLRQLEDVIEVYEDITYNLHTTHSPQFLGLFNNILNLKHQTLQEQLYEPSQNVIIGVLDTGVWPESQSFNDHKMSSMIPSRWKGGCDNATDCNKKLIGARGFINGSNIASARDSVGHGTHTASTAAGALVQGANLFGYAPGIAQGMAPGARLAIYKVCSEHGCNGSDIVAGIDAALSDGVDILSISLGAPENNTIDFIGLVTFRAMVRGIFVSCAAGNDGPTPASVSNGAPWIMTVGAGTMDRDFPAYVTLGNGMKYKGVSLYSGKRMGKKSVELVYGTSNNSKLCFPNFLNSSAVKGKVVICDRGITARMAKGMVVKAAGGVGMILANTEKDGRQLSADSHVLPAVAVTYKDGAMIKTFAASKNHVKVLLTFGGTVMNVRPSPQVTTFSSRGPYKPMQGILKPDIIGPGLNILAAWPEVISPSGVDGDYRKTKFNIVSGTSMSCPHISGLAALLKAAHPDWSPSAIKSALMTTAYTLDNTNSSILDMADNSTATPWALGAGHVDIVTAMYPGLVYNATPDDFIALLCSYYKNNITIVRVISATNTDCTKKLNDPGQLNYPSFSVVFNKYAGILTYSRKLTNVENVQSTYNVYVDAPPNVKVSVNPSTLVFKKIGDSKHYNVTFTLKKKKKKKNVKAENQDTATFGSITWMNGKNRVRSPVAISMQSY